jgi:predicted RNase H-like HicB family nuclease
MWCARGLGVEVLRQGETFDELLANIREAVAVHFVGEEAPDTSVVSA